MADRAVPGPVRAGAHLGADPLAGIALLEDLPLAPGSRVLVRGDFNVPLRRDDRGRVFVEDDYRIRAALPTLRWLADHGAAVTVCTHLGRPHGRPDPSCSLQPLRPLLAELAPGVELLENLRFDPGEEGNDPQFVRRLVDGFDAYVNDAFGASHRAHGSIVGPPTLVPSAAGRLLQREVEVVGGLLADPARPFVAVVGGAKVADKLGLLRSLLSKVDRLVVGGAMAYTFLVATGRKMGASLVDEALVEDCVNLVDEAGGRLVLPTDVVALAPDGRLAPGNSGTGSVATFDMDVEAGWGGADMGPDTIRRFTAAIAGAKTVFWNGPVGAFEDERFASGTRAVAEAVAGCAGFSVVGGGDSVAALHHLGLGDRVAFVSTGGGAALELLEHGDLPGLAALRQAGITRERTDDG